MSRGARGKPMVEVHGGSWEKATEPKEIEEDSEVSAEEGSW